MSSEQASLKQRILELEAETETLRRTLRATRDEHERVISALRLSEEKFSRAFHASPDSVNINRVSDGKYLAINPGFTSLTGYTEADVIGRTSLEIEIWADPADRKRLVQGLLAHGRVDEMQADFRLKDGAVKTALMSARIIEVHGERCILSITRDISERLRAEEALRHSEEKLRELIDLAVDGILLGDSSGVIVGANQRACELVGRAPSEIIGVHISELFAPDSLKDKPLRFDLLNRGQTVVTERMMARRDGTRVPVEMKSRRMPDGSYHSFVRDLTERIRAERDRAAIEERLRHAERNEALGRLAGGIAHDLNNLLTPIQLSASMILADHASELGIRSELEGILEAAERAGELTRQILAFSRKQVLRLQPIDMNQEIMRTERMLRRVIGENVEIRLELSPDLPAVLADASQIQQVLLNLAINARDALPNGGWMQLKTTLFDADEACASQTTGLEPGRYVRLDVSDNGTGMDGETLRQAFDPFFTTKQPGQGTGLGLATVRGIVEQHHGALWATSCPDLGSTFIVCMPISTEGATRSPASGPPVLERKTGKETVLLAEDDALVRSAARRILEGDGYTVVSADSGATALQCAEAMQGEIDILVTDVIMPGLTGRQLHDQLSKRFPGIAVLYISGYPDNALAPHGVLDSAVHFLGKPFTAAALSTAVRSVLDERPGGVKCA
ncbi:MAG: PAS domain S-box protein [Deltaproteobacteria bacterium]|nr:PAS domain S-box protein [Deltaproteobacteria bacterium]